MLIDSAPPAMMIWAPPERIRSAAMAMACSPDEQKRLMVTPGTESGKPARSAATRAIFIPDSPSGLAQPRITSSISLDEIAGYFSRSRRNTVAARSSGRVVRSVPLGAFPTAVRRQSTITAFITLIRCLLIAQRFTCFQHMLHAFLSLRISAQAQECFALQVQKILLGHGLLAGQAAAREDVP